MLSRAPKSDAAVFLVAFGLTIFLDLVTAIGVGVVLASFLFMRRMADVADVKCVFESEEEDKASELLPEIKTPELVSFYEISGPFFFGAADKFVNTIREMNFSSSVLILKMSHVPAMDATAFHGLEMLYDMCEKNNTMLIFLELQQQPLNMLKKYGFVDAVGEENFCLSLEEAITRANTLVGQTEDFRLAAPELA
jgi:SulP family sulfate permease